MPLVTTEKMLTDAQKGGYAVGAFNVENMGMVMKAVPLLSQNSACNDMIKHFQTEDILS